MRCAFSKNGGSRYQKISRLSSPASCIVRMSETVFCHDCVRANRTRCRSRERCRMRSAKRSRGKRQSRDLAAWLHPPSGPARRLRMPLNDVRFRKRHCRARSRSPVNTPSLNRRHVGRLAVTARQASARSAACSEKTTLQKEPTSVSTSASATSSTTSFSSIATETDAPPANGSTKSLGRRPFTRSTAAMYDASRRFPPG
jgi:hypothetical protein